MKKKYNFPSGFEVEKPLRRKFRRERKYGWVAILLFIACLTLLYVLVSRVVDYQANQAALLKKAYAAEAQPLCDRLGDPVLAGTAAEASLARICL